jgi:hypothetical protein
MSKARSAHQSTIRKDSRRFSRVPAAASELRGRQPAAAAKSSPTSSRSLLTILLNAFSMRAA